MSGTHREDGGHDAAAARRDLGPVPLEESLRGRSRGAKGHHGKGLSGGLGVGILRRWYSAHAVAGSDRGRRRRQWPWKTSVPQRSRERARSK
ncbi:hypothetical protein V498_06538 [Pseudogymnoascus sp. VKM F-4517 (FW-2822)]|nr:hypothetical protein V498_06538 [Pseudogymnoascus sp. VKM F-4517 (FW-2822)]